jgi:hypothetical protein
MIATPLAVGVGTILTGAGVIFVILVVVVVGFLFLFRDVRPAWREGTALGAFKIFLRTSDGIDDVSTSCVDLTFQIRHAGGAVLKMLSSVVRSKNFEVDDNQRREFLALILATNPADFIGDGNFQWALVGLKSFLSRKRALWCLLEKGRTFNSYSRPSSKRSWSWSGIITRNIIDGDFVPIPFPLDLGNIGADIYAGFFIPTSVIHSAKADLARSSIEKMTTLYAQFFSLLSTAQPSAQLIEAKDKYIADLEALRRQDQETIAGLSAKGIADTYTGKGLIKISGGAGKTPVVKGQRQWLTYLMIWLIPMVAVGIAAALAPKSSVFAFVGLIAALPVITMILSLRR